MKKTIFLILTVVTLFSCGQKENASIQLDVPGAGDKEIVLSKLLINKIEVIDTLKTNAQGSVKYKVKVGEKTPEFFYLSYNRKRLVSLILKGGDNVNITVDTLGKGLKINGSEESIRLVDIEKDVYCATVKFDSLSRELVAAIDIKDNEKADKIRYELGDLYVKQKRAAITGIMTNPYSFANLTLLYQQLNENLPLFASTNDLVYYKRVYDSLQLVYPNSAYVKSLKEEVTNYENAMVLNNKISQAEESAFPEIALPDTQSNIQKLSALYGKPFILLFWSSTNADQKMFNQDLKELYAKYHPKGLEIYQVSADMDKTLWATVVKEQELPWINVCDGLGTASSTLSTYNVTQLPTMFVFDKSGNISARNIFDKQGLNAALSKLAY